MNNDKNQNRADNGVGSTGGSLSALTAEWESLVEKRWKEVRSVKGVYLSKWNPQVTMNRDMRARQETRDELMVWTVTWWASHGLAVVCEPDGRDGFSVFSANIPHQRTPEGGR